jgi:hypothetical protein
MAAHADKRMIRNANMTMLFSYFLVGCTSNAEYAAHEAAQWAFSNGMAPGFCGHVHGIRDSRDTRNQELYAAYSKEVSRRGWNCDIYKNFTDYRQRYEHALTSGAKARQTEPQAAREADGSDAPPSAPNL